MSNKRALSAPSTEAGSRARRYVQVLNQAPSTPQRCPPPYQEQLEAAKKFASGLLSLAFYILVIGAIAWAYLGKAPGSLTTSSSSPKPVAPSAPHSSLPSSAVQYPVLTAASSHYSDALAGVLLASPELDPQSLSYRSEQAVRYKRLLQQYLNNGAIPSAAVQQAYGEYRGLQSRGTIAESPQRQTARLEPQQRSASASNRRVAAHTESAKRPCIFKGVMTDDDYQACGLEPPRAH